MLLLDLALAILASSGPFASLEDYCKQALWGGERPQICQVTHRIDDVRIPALKGSADKFLQIAWIQIGETNGGGYSLAIRGAAGWFVSEMPLGYSIRGRGYSRVSSVEIDHERLVVRTTSAGWIKPLTDAQMAEDDGDRFYDVGTVTFCGLGSSGRISCAPGFICAAKVEIPGEPSRFDFDAFRNPAWELPWKLEDDGVTFAASAKEAPTVWGRRQMPREARDTPGHHPLHFP